MRKSLSYKIIIPVIILLGLFSAVCYLFALERYEKGRLSVRIVDVWYPNVDVRKEKTWLVLYDDEVNETFDYSQLCGREVFFYQKMDPTELSNSDVAKIEELLFSDLEGGYQHLRDLDVPNIVVGFIRFICNGSYEEVYMKYFKKPFKRPTGWGTHMIWKNFGGYSGTTNRVIYNVERRLWEEGIHVVLTKRYKFDEKHFHYVWSLDFILLYGIEPSIIKASLTRYPYQTVTI